jgi:hypothetical protein
LRTNDPIDAANTSSRTAATRGECMIAHARRKPSMSRTTSRSSPSKFRSTFGIARGSGDSRRTLPREYAL